MRQVVLADTGPLYAAVDPTDHYHLQAQSERLGLPVWTYDYHFNLMRANVWR